MLASQTWIFPKFNKHCKTDQDRAVKEVRSDEVRPPASSESTVALPALCSDKEGPQELGLISSQACTPQRQRLPDAVVHGLPPRST